MFCLLVCMSIFLTSCWDSINLEDRGFVIGTGIDLEDGNYRNGEHPVFAVTSQIVNPAGVGITENGAGDEEAFVNITSVGSSIYRTDAILAEKSSKVPFYEHMDLLIISKDVAHKENLLSEILDTYIRNVKMRRSIVVVISDGSPKEILEYMTPEKKIPSIQIVEMLEKGSRYSGFLKPIVLGDLEEHHLTENSYIIPMIALKDEVEFSSGAVFQGPEKRMVGNFDVDEIRGLTLMTSNTTGNIIDFPYKNEMFAFEIEKIKNRLHVDTTNVNEIQATFDIKLEGIIKESFGKEDFTKSEEVNAVQQAVSQEVKNLAQKAITKGQKKLNADVFRIWEHLENKHHKTWKKIRNDWEQGENYFSKVTFDVNIDTEVYSMGTTNKTD